MEEPKIVIVIERWYLLLYLYWNVRLWWMLIRDLIRYFPLLFFCKNCIENMCSCYWTLFWIWSALYDVDIWYLLCTVALCPYNLLLVEIFILYYVRMYVALDKIFHVWRHDQDTNSYTDGGRNWGLSLECARTDIMQDTGEGRSKVKHLYFWLMFLWSLLSTFPADGGCMNGVPLHMTGNVTASDHAPEAAAREGALPPTTPPTTPTLTFPLPPRRCCHGLQNCCCCYRLAIDISVDIRVDI